MTIGKGGAVIRAITEKTGTTIDIRKTARSPSPSVNGDAANAAKSRIDAITADVEVGKAYEERFKILDFGAIVRSCRARWSPAYLQIANERVNAVEDYLKEGQVVRVKGSETDDRGRVRLSMKALRPEEGGVAPSAEVAQQQQQQQQ